MEIEIIHNDFNEIEESVMLRGWFHFGNKCFICPGLGWEEQKYYEKNSELPEPCDRCYKALIFWKDSYSKQNVENFLTLINSLKTDYLGKFNKSVIVFYFRRKTTMLKFLDLINRKMGEYHVKGKTQWRRACKEYQRLKPELWKNAREFIPEKNN